MLSSPNQPAPQQSAGYNGVVEVAGQQVPVKHGVAQFQGDFYFVSDDGMIVSDQTRKIVGSIDGGQFKPLTQDHLQRLRDMGYIEE